MLINITLCLNFYFCCNFDIKCAFLECSLKAVSFDMSLGF